LIAYTLASPKAATSQSMPERQGLGRLGLLPNRRYALQVRVAVQVRRRYRLVQYRALIPMCVPCCYRGAAARTSHRRMCWRGACSADEPAVI
jgi:hypothetical protein